MKAYLFSLLLLMTVTSSAQQNLYTDSLQSFRTRYITTHGVVKEKDQALLSFYPISEKYNIPAKVERIYEAPWFQMPTSGAVKKTFRVYAVLHFNVEGKTYKLTAYQSQQLMDVKEYADYLFIPFTDITNGEETYENGRYIDITTGELEKNDFSIDFNKCYNPYCAYVSNVFNCPVPPAENSLPVAIKAGEKKYGKLH